MINKILSTEACRTSHHIQQQEKWLTSEDTSYYDHLYALNSDNFI